MRRVIVQYLAVPNFKRTLHWEATLRIALCASVSPASGFVTENGMSHKIQIYVASVASSAILRQKSQRSLLLDLTNSKHEINHCSHDLHNLYCPQKRPHNQRSTSTRRRTLPV